VIGEDGKMTKLAGPPAGEAGSYSGLSTAEARKKVLEDLEKGGFLGKEKDYLHSVGHCQRCDEVVEPLTSKQWFIKMKPLAKPAIDVIKQNKIEIQPKHFEKIYFDWLNNIRDWCISRQLWWGHQIPVYYCLECDSKKENPIVSEEKIEKCPKCKGSKIEQDPDVLDTWFSSALWPFSALGWPKMTDDYETFYPNDLMENGRDILFFWDARMIMLGLYFTKKIPFRHLYLHGMVLDRKGRKMSKSLGNGIDPIEMIDKYGADALRMSLVVGLTPGNDMRMYEEKIKGYRNFSNKLWNISRFILSKTDQCDTKYLKLNKNLFGDRILSRLQEVIKDVTSSLERYKLGEAGEILYKFIWKDFADWTLFPVYGFFGNKKQKDAILRYVLDRILRLSHPFMPFVTEEIWSHLNQDSKLIISDWPKVDKKLIDQKAEKEFEIIRDLIVKIRNHKAESKIKFTEDVKVRIDVYENKEMKKLIDDQVHVIKKLVGVNTIDYSSLQGMGTLVGPFGDGKLKGGFAFVGTKKIQNLTKRRKEKDNLEKYISTVRRKLENEDFIKNAPEEIVEQEKKKLKEAEEKLKRL